MKVICLFLTVLFLLLILSGSATGEIQKQQFEQIIDLVKELYEPVFKSKQQRLRIMDYWESERLEASARYDMDNEGRLAVITITGGLARHPRNTEGAFALVICHEIGHFLAGLPAIGRFSTEGQSDYFAASACMRRLIPRHLRGGYSGYSGCSDSGPEAMWSQFRRCMEQIHLHTDSYGRICAQPLFCAGEKGRPSALRITRFE